MSSAWSGRNDADRAAREADRRLSLSAYRIVQEGLTNAVKHGTPAPICVRIDYGTANLTIDIRNRRRPSPAGGDPGYGLIGVRERALTVGGEIRAECHGDDWVLHARLPYTAKHVGSPA